MASVGALALGASGAQAQDPPPYQNVVLEYGAGPTDLVFRFTVPAGTNAQLLILELNVPVEVTSAVVGTTPCQINRSPDGHSTVACQGMFAPGTTYTVAMTTAERYQTNGGGKASGGTSDGKLIPPVDVPGPASGPGPGGPAPLRYDLDLRTDSGSIFSVDPDNPFGGFSIYLQHPPTSPKQRPSESTFLTVTTNPSLPVTGRLTAVSRTQEARTQCDPFQTGAHRCPVDPIAPDAPEVFADTLIAPAVGRENVNKTFRFRADLDCRAPAETECGNNSLERDLTLRGSGDSDALLFVGATLVGLALGYDSSPPRRSAADSASAAARAARVLRRDRPRRVEVAMLRLARGQRAFTGVPAPPSAVAGGTETCSWLSSRRARFRAQPIGLASTCDRPIWLRAKGTKRWSFRLSKKLRPGRYVAYSRVVTRAGAVEQSFTKRDGNRRTFRVKKRR